MQGGGIVVSYTYILHNKKIDRPNVRLKLRKNFIEEKEHLSKKLELNLLENAKGSKQKACGWMA